MLSKLLGARKGEILLSIFFIVLFCSYYQLETSLIKSGKFNQGGFQTRHTELSSSNELRIHPQQSPSNNIQRISATDLAACKAAPNIPFKGQAQHDLVLYEKLFSKPDRCEGTIVEVGALDGSMFSNSWFFEKALNWKALLIEPQPDNFEKLVRNRPNAINVETAICTTDKFGNSNKSFRSRPGALSGLVHTMSEGHFNRFNMNRDDIIQVPCAPLSQVLHDHQIHRIDVIFVDVEGAEIEVLNTMDWNIPVLVWIVELDGNDTDKDMSVRRVLNKNGYCKVEDWDVNMFCRNCVRRDEFYRPC